MYAQENYGLKELYLHWNGFAAEGAKAMGHALKHNQCLEELDLSYNRIPEQGAIDLAGGVGTNDQLRALKVSNFGVFNFHYHKHPV